MTHPRDTADRARVELRPGVFVWLSGADLVAFREQEPIESASVTAPENAALPKPKPRAARKRTTSKGA